eukprot:m.91090 g.91090  ORF g.91090 m.91090 type:complete len:175 (-) comp14892_c0_seq4:1268-1792(-)
MPKVKVTTAFPPAKIKRLMQTDEEVGKISQGAPVVISRILESFLKDLVDNSVKDEDGVTRASLQPGHMKATINQHPRFDFVREVVAKYSDAITSSKRSKASADGQTKPKRRKPAAKKAPKAKATPDASTETSTSAPVPSAQPTSTPSAFLATDLTTVPTLMTDPQQDDDDDEYD